MKQIITILLIVLFCTTTLSAQQIRYESSFDKAQQLSAKEQKPLAVLITIRQPLATPGSMSGISDSKVVEKFNSSFINYKVDKSDTLKSGPILRKYNIHRLPCILFLDAKGGILFSDIALLSWPEPLLAYANKALEMAKGKSMADFDSEYAAGNSNHDFLKAYIQKRQSSGIRNNAALIEKYVNDLKVSDLNKYDEVLFILKAGPILNSTTHKLMVLNGQLFDSIFKKEPFAVCQAINNAIIDNSMESAIAAKNRNLAFAVANFTRNTWGKNYMEGQKQSELKLIQYYLAIKDSVQYLHHARFYYDAYYMRITVDSILKIDSLNRMRAAENAEIRVAVYDRKSVYTKSFSYTPAIEQYAAELNNAAWNFYCLADNNHEYLTIAMLWSKRSIELNPKSAYFDTYAHLLYRLRFFEIAETTQKQAVKFAKEHKEDSKKYMDEFLKMKSRTL